MTLIIPAADKYPKFVARGMALLDEQRPGWLDRIDLATLAMHDPCHCIVGQEFGDGVSNDDGIYGDGLEALGVADDPDGYGFDAWDQDALGTEWRRAITERRAAS